jgi:hypothetical protein
MKGDNMKRVQVLIVVVVIISIMTAVYAYAEDENPCEKDIAKFCKNIEPGEGRILRCLTLSKEEVTPSCKKQLDRIENALTEVKLSCADDYAIFCSSVVPGQGRIAACLEKNEKILTPKCKADLKEVEQKAREIQEQIKKK